MCPKNQRQNQSVTHQINIPKQDYYEYPEKMVIYAAFFMCPKNQRQNQSVTHQNNLSKRDYYEHHEKKFASLCPIVVQSHFLAFSRVQIP